jgi:hypothetical protein
MHGQPQLASREVERTEDGVACLAGFKNGELGRKPFRKETRYPSGLCCPLKGGSQFTCSALSSIQKYARVRGITAQVQVKGAKAG